MTPGMGFGLLGMLLLWGILIAFLVGGGVLVFRQATGLRLWGRQDRPTVGQVVDKRLARGESDVEEYDAIRNRLLG